MHVGKRLERPFKFSQSGFFSYRVLSILFTQLDTEVYGRVLKNEQDFVLSGFLLNFISELKSGSLFKHSSSVLIIWEGNNTYWLTQTLCQHYLKAVKPHISRAFSSELCNKSDHIFQYSHWKWMVCAEKAGEIIVEMYVFTWRYQRKYFLSMTPFTKLNEPTFMGKRQCCFR